MKLNSALAAGTVALALGTGSAWAAPVVTTTSDATVLTNAVLAPASGITVLTSVLTSGQVSQQGTYTGFNLVPSSGPTPTLTLQDGIVLSSGRADVGNSNTVNETTVNTGNGGFAPLTTLAGVGTLNANVLEITFEVTAGLNAITLDFIFGTEEFPTQTVTDIFGVFVDGVNYARFPNGDLIANEFGNPTNFIDNPVGAGLYDIEYNGLTRRLTLIGLLDTNLTTHTLQIGIADTSDTRFDSGVYVAGLRAINSDNGGGIVDVPEPMSLALFGLGLAGLGVAARRRKA